MIIRDPHNWRADKRGSVYRADVCRDSKWGRRTVASVDVDDHNEGFPGEPDVHTGVSISLAPTPEEMRELATVLREAADAAERHEAHASAPTDDDPNPWEVSRV